MSKFDSEVAENLYNLSLNNLHDDVTGDVDWIGYYTKFYEDPSDSVTPGAYILCEDSQGFVSVQQFADNVDLDDAWSDLEREYSAWYDEEPETL